MRSAQKKTASPVLTGVTNGIPCGAGLAVLLQRTVFTQMSTHENQRQKKTIYSVKFVKNVIVITKPFV